MFHAITAFCVGATMSCAIWPGALPQESSLQDPPPGGGARTQPGQQRSPQAGIKPYKDVITADYTSRDGVFKVHRKGDKVYFEVPAGMLGRDFLWVTELAGTPSGGYSGTAGQDTLVRFVRRGDKLLLKTVTYSARSTGDDNVRISVEASNLEPIAQTFDIEALGDGDAPVVDVSRYLVSDPAEFSVRGLAGGGALDNTRSFIDDVKTFPTNINVTATLTFRGGGAEVQAGPGGGRRGGARTGPSSTAIVHYSIVLLPEQPMMGRLFDSRLGFFSVQFDDYGTDEPKVATRKFITRYRLEKSNPSEAISKPVKPIVYYLSREIPEVWRKYVKMGVEDWQPAFEQAGFKEAIVAKDPPTKDEDPDWSPEDARYSVIRWAPTATENAMGPHYHDPRSGEIISAHIIIWHNILNLQTKWYFSQASPMDKRAQKLPFPVELMGECLRYVVAHEVGHTLGLQHNFKASSTYSVDQLRSKEFTEKYGDEASIMDYGRFNYVAQPGDNARLIPMVGPYDKFAMEWGYKPISGAKNPADEKVELDRMAARQVQNPMLRFGSNPSFGSDPSQQSEDLGSDGVEATRLGMQNLKRVMSYIVPATTKRGEDYQTLSEIYGAVWGQYATELGHLLPIVGGMVMTDYHAGRSRGDFDLVPKDRQRAAVALIASSCFATPTFLMPEDVVRRLGPSAPADRLSGIQSRFVSGLLSDTRIVRLLDQEHRFGSQAYTVSDMLGQMRSSIWSELGKGEPVSVYRRTLQRMHVNALAGKLDTKTSEVRAIATNELIELRKLIARGMGSARDGATKSHLYDLDRIIQEALMLKHVIPQPSATPQQQFPFFEAPPRGCWDDWE